MQTIIKFTKKCLNMVFSREKVKKVEFFLSMVHIWCHGTTYETEFLLNRDIMMQTIIQFNK